MDKGDETADSVSNIGLIIFQLKQVFMRYFKVSLTYKIHM